MKASLCVGEYCENTYNVESLEQKVYCMEELCYCLKENAFLLDLSLMNDKLIVPHGAQAGITQRVRCDDSAICGDV